MVEADHPSVKPCGNSEEGEIFGCFKVGDLQWLIVGEAEKEMRYTPLKTNMSPENQWLEDVFPIEMVPFWGTC